MGYGLLFLSHGSVPAKYRSQEIPKRALQSHTDHRAGIGVRDNEAHLANVPQQYQTQMGVADTRLLPKN